MRIVCIGGGPAGLYFGLLMKKQNPGTKSPWSSATARTTPSAGASCSPTRRSATCKPPTRRARTRSSTRSTTGTTSRSTSAGAPVRSGGHGFCGIGRKRLLNILQARCEELGVKLVFETEVHGRRSTTDADLIIACDGLNSRSPHEVRRAPTSPTSTCAIAASSGSAPTSSSTPSRSLRENRMRLVPGPRVPLRRSTPPRSSSRRPSASGARPGSTR